MGTRDHMKNALQVSETHQPGEENGCVTKCLYTATATSKAGKPSKFVCEYEGHGYIDNGWSYTVANNKAWYNIDFTQQPHKDEFFAILGKKKRKQVWRDPTRTQGAWFIGDGPYGTVNYKSGKYWPFSNEGHHIVPTGALFDAFADNIDHLEMLQKGKYNINRGVNIIFLPKREPHGRLLKLLCHPDNHPSYSKKVKNEINKLKDELAESAEEEEHPELKEEDAPKLGQELEAFSKRMRVELKKQGERQPGMPINNAVIR